MKRLLKYCAFLILCGLLSSCMDPYHETTKVKTLDAFSTLLIKSVFTVYLVQDTTYLVKIVADEGAINQVDARVDGDTLYLIDNNKGKWTKPESNKITVYVHSPNHAQISAESTYALFSTNAITSDQLSIFNDAAVKLSEINLTLACNSFNFWNNYLAGGKLTLSGTCDNLEIDNYALHVVNAISLKARTGTITSYSKADCSVFVSDRLECNIHGTGNIYVYGNPPSIIVNERTSTGEVIKVN